MTKITIINPLKKAILHYTANYKELSLRRLRIRMGKLRKLVGDK